MNANPLLNINLLPWREQQRHERKRQYIILMVTSALLGILCVLVMHIVIAGSISSQQARNRYLEQEVKLLDAKIKSIKDLQKERQNLLARMEIIEKLQKSRYLVVRFFDAIVNIIPDGVTILDISHQGNVINLVGKAESNARISKLMRNIEASSELSKPVLTEIKREKQQGSTLSDFKLQFKQNLPQDKDAEAALL